MKHQAIPEHSVIRYKKVLVTGGAGFIGSNLCEDLLKQNNEVICLDNFSTGHRRNLASFSAHPSFKLIEGDICNLDDCRKASDGVEIVLHQAALGSIPRSIANPIATNDSNVGGFVNVLLAARDAGVKRVVYASSSTVYGDWPELPRVEDRIGKPMSPYGVSKVANELYAHVFGINYGMEIIGLRYFNVFGPRQNPEGPYATVIPKFIMQLKQHERPVINGDGTFSRDFTYIDNVIAMNHLAATTTNEQAIGQVFNAATGQQYTLNQLLLLLKKTLSRYDPAIAEIEPVYGPVRQGDFPHSRASVERAKQLLGFEPVTMFEEGLLLTTDWFWNHL